jgi:hypothetical protein
MACVKMLLAYRLRTEVPLVELCQRCVAYGGYIVNLHEVQGLIYQPCIHMLKKDFGLVGRVAAPLSLKGILRALAQQKFVIASVHPMIRHAPTPDTPPHRGGHLVLLVGFDKTRKLLYLHNPSGHSPSSQEYAEVSFRDFQKFYAQRGMVIS